MSAEQGNERVWRREPHPGETETPLFNAIWRVVKWWEIDGGGSKWSATGNDVCGIIDSIRESEQTNTQTEFDERPISSVYISCPSCKAIHPFGNCAEYQKALANHLRVSSGATKRENEPYMNAPAAEAQPPIVTKVRTWHTMQSTETAEAQPASVVEKVRELRDKAYCDYAEQLRRPECLGFDAKMKAHEFGVEELTAHTHAGILLGKHQAFAAVLTILAEGKPLSEKDFLEELKP